MKTRIACLGLLLALGGCTPSSNPYAWSECVIPVQEAFPEQCLGSVGGGTSWCLRRVETFCGVLYPTENIDTPERVLFHIKVVAAQCGIIPMF